jgi:hypothetical protein
MARKVCEGVLLGEKIAACGIDHQGASKSDMVNVLQQVGASLAHLDTHHGVEGAADVGRGVRAVARRYARASAAVNEAYRSGWETVFASKPARPLQRQARPVKRRIVV